MKGLADLDRSEVNPIVFGPCFASKMPTVGDFVVRRAAGLIVVGCLLASGCSCLIAQSGRDIMAMDNRDAVRHKLGSPIASGTEEGRCFDDFRYRGKVREPVAASGFYMADAMTWGLVEFIAFQIALHDACCRCFRGQDLRIYYDGTGKWWVMMSMATQRADSRVTHT